MKMNKCCSRMNKYGAKPTIVGGIRFASKAEANRFILLRQLERQGDITDLETQPKFKVAVAGHHICNYLADFRYKQDGAEVIEDVKGVRTPVYKLKKKLVEALHGIEIMEIK
jgi:hypothetical protein